MNILKCQKRDHPHFSTKGCERENSLSGQNKDEQLRFCSFIIEKKDRKPFNHRLGVTFQCNNFFLFLSLFFFLGERGKGERQERTRDGSKFVREALPRPGTKKARINKRKREVHSGGFTVRVDYSLIPL